jgi:hypothetical protein
MFPAARVLDPLTHDLTVPSGLIDYPVSGPCPQPVMIEFLEAAHVGCICKCSGATSAGPVHPPVPIHPFGTPIVMGSKTVKIHFMMAARWAPSGDVAGCGVFLGNPALAASRKTIIGG